MSASKQLAIKEVLNLEIMDFTTGDPIFYADYASNTSIESSAERLDLRGGQGNYKLVSFDHTKNMVMKSSLPLVDLEFVSMLTGKDMVLGTINLHKREVLTVNGSNQVTLAATPVSGTLNIYLLSNDRDNGTEQTEGSTGTQNKYSISGQQLTFNVTTCPENTKVVCSYDYEAPATTRTMTFTADKFAGYCRMVGDGIVTDQVTGETYYTKFDIKKVKPKNNFTITMMSTDATKLEIEFDMYSVDVTNDDGSTDKVYCYFHELV